MSWTPLPDRPRTHMNDGVSVALRKVSGSTNLRVVVVLRPEVMGRAGWDLNDPISVIVGGDGHLGKIILRPAPASQRPSSHIRRSAAGRKYADFGSINIHPWPDLPKEKRRALNCAYEITDRAFVGGMQPGEKKKEIYITLPQWAGTPVRQYQDHQKAAANSRL
ncbi:MAG: hypothetical protein V3W41_22545 [Planctomycetota bacterium]